MSEKVITKGGKAVKKENAEVPKLTIAILLQRMQYANVRGTIALQQICAIIIAEFVHLNDALIVQLYIKIILEDINFLWFFCKVK